MSRLAIPWSTLVLCLNLPACAGAAPVPPSSCFLVPAALPPSLAWLLPPAPSHREVKLQIHPPGPFRAGPGDSHLDLHLVSAQAPAGPARAPVRPDLGPTGLTPGFRF